MTTKNNTKKFLSIIVIAIIGSMLFITCKAKPTDLNNYQVEEPAVNPTNPETPNPTNENSQKVEVKIDNNNDLRQFGEGTRENFKGYHYVSKGYIPHEFTATVGWDSYQYYIQFEDGYKFYQGAGPSCKGANYKLVIQSGASRNGGACQYADVVFTTNGYLYVKFNNYSWTIEYALSKKEEVKDNTNDSEISKDGASIPEEHCGRYTVKSVNWGNEAYSGYWRDIYWDVKSNAISFTGGKFFPIKSAKYTSGNFHDIYYNDGLIVTTDFTNGGVMYYLFLKDGNNYTVRTTNTLGNPTYYITYSSKD